MYHVVPSHPQPKSVALLTANKLRYLSTQSRVTTTEEKNSLVAVKIHPEVKIIFELKFILSVFNEL